MIIAVVGCTHGELDLIYSTLAKIENAHNFKVDLLICCGDFQSIRMPSDNDSLNVPDKYKSKINDFQAYYTGEKTAPVLTIFIGGNHEAMNVLKQLYYGGWVAPNIYFLGYSNVHNINNFRIASLSGIYKKYNFLKKYEECYPFSKSSRISAYHVRKYEIEKLSLLKENIDIMITHDWPNEIEKYGNLEELLHKKKFFRAEVQNNTLGNPHTKMLLNKLKPSLWFAAHLHVKYAAIYVHKEGDERYTRFLSLDKAYPNKQFMQILNIEKKEGIICLNNIPMRNQEWSEEYDGSNAQSCIEDDTLEDKTEQNSEATGEEKKKTNIEEKINNIEVIDSQIIEEGDENEKEKRSWDEDKQKGDNTNEEQSENVDKRQNVECLGKETQTDETTYSENDKTTNKLYICYDIEWLSILKANHHLISISSDKNYNTETLKYPSLDDLNFIKKQLQSNIKQIQIENKTHYLIHGYNYPPYKNLYEQRQLFLNIFHFEELSIYNEYEKKHFYEEASKLEN